MPRLWILAIIGAAIGGTVFVAYAYAEALPGPLQKYAPVIRQGAESGFSSLKNLASKSKDAQPAVLGIKSESSRIFQEDTAGKPLHQKAMEYTQYQYCKLIVKDYEAEQEKVSQNPTPTPEESPEE